MRRQEHHRHVMARANLLGGGDAIALTIDVDVHQDQVGAGGLLHRLLGGFDRGYDLVAESFQARCDIVAISPSSSKQMWTRTF